MIKHEYVNASDNLAQWSADQIGRQQVDADWYLDHMADKPVFMWVSDESYELGLDPWRFDLDVYPSVDRGYKLFVQVRDIPDHLMENHVGQHGDHDIVQRYLGKQL